MSPNTMQSSTPKSSAKTAKGVSAKQASTSAKIVKKAKAPVPLKEGSWKEVRHYLDETEKRLHELGNRVEDFSVKIESKTKAKADELEEYYKGVHIWLSSQIDKVRSFEASTETWYDTALVKTHLAKMEATDAAGEFIHRLDKLRSRLDQLTSKTTSETTSELLKSFSHAFSTWKDKVIH